MLLKDPVLYVKDERNYSHLEMMASTGKQSPASFEKINYPCKYVNTKTANTPVIDFFFHRGKLAIIEKVVNNKSREYASVKIRLEPVTLLAEKQNEQDKRNSSELIVEIIYIPLCSWLLFLKRIESEGRRYCPRKICTKNELR